MSRRKMHARRMRITRCGLLLAAAALVACGGGNPTPEQATAPENVSAGSGPEISTDTAKGPPVETEPTAAVDSAAVEFPHRPDACGLVTQADLEALFPGRAVQKTDQHMSPLNPGPQYVQGCTHTVRLPDPRSSGDITSYVQVVVIDADADAGDFDAQLQLRSGMTHIGNATIERVDGIGDQAFRELSDREVSAHVRKGRVLYLVKLDRYSEQSLPNLTALARQAASRWSDGGGMQAGDGVLAANAEVEVPPDTRQSRQAPAGEWPDACKLLVRADVEEVYPGAKIKGPDAMRASLTHTSRAETTTPLPHPIACTFNVFESADAGGKRESDTTIVSLTIVDMASTPEFAQRMFKSSGGDATVAGLADEARLDTPARTLVMRKGRLVVRLRAGSAGGGRDQTAHERDLERLRILAPEVAARLP